MSITLYGYTASRATRNLWVLEELNLPYTQDPIKTRDPSSRTPEYLAIFQTGTHYQLIHALALFGVGLLALHVPGR